MILGKEETEIVKKAVEYQSTMTDGVVQYNYETDELFGAGFTTGTVENPANPFIEVFRLKQGEMGQIDMKCHENGDCPFWIEDENSLQDGYFDEDKVDEYGCDRICCCINGYVDSDGFSDDFESNYREGVEMQIRDVLSDFLGSTISKLNEIRIAVSDIVAPYNRIKVRQEDWETNVLDSYVDYAISDGFSTTETTSLGYVDAEVQHIANMLYFSDDENLQQVGKLVENGDLDEALSRLQ